MPAAVTFATAFSVWETRVQDYEVFKMETKRDWAKTKYAISPAYPATNVNWEDAQAFCAWLTESEDRAGKLDATSFYRLPSDHEWSCAVGIGEHEDPASLPSMKHAGNADAFPWGNSWPPPPEVANISGEEASGKEAWFGQVVLPGYRDKFSGPSPVGTFAPNALGLFDLAGNLWEWCEDWSDETRQKRVLRSSSFGSGGRGGLISSCRSQMPQTQLATGNGFRIVLAAARANAAKSTPTPLAAAGSVAFGGHRYQFVRGAITWAQAKAKAESLSGHLATVTSDEEAEVIRGLLDGEASTVSGWLGASRLTADAPWEWITGEKFDFTRWDSAEPDKGLGEAPWAICCAPNGRWHDEGFTVNGKGFSRGGFFVELEDERQAKAPAAVSATPPSFATATKDAPFVNTLGMKFVPVPITGGPTDKQRVLFSIWETRVQDYEPFGADTKRGYLKPTYPQDPSHPAVNVRWDEAQAFCEWLTQRERLAGQLRATQRYRLPTDHEWSCAVSLGDREDPAKLPAEKDGKIPSVFPWGNTWPPPPGTGNFSGEETGGHFVFPAQKMLAGYRDHFPHTAPVGSFAANAFGIFDLSGNAREWCDDWFEPEQQRRVGRGGSFLRADWGALWSSTRSYDPPAYRGEVQGFRCVLAEDPPAPPAAK